MAGGKGKVLDFPNGKPKRNGDEPKRGGRKSTPGTFGPEKKQLFLEHYSTGITVNEAARLTGISAITVYNHARWDPDGFGKDYASARELNTDKLEDHLHRMATESGVPGNVAALFGTLKARRPEKWRDAMNRSDGSAGGKPLQTLGAALVASLHAQERAAENSPRATG